VAERDPLDALRAAWRELEPPRPDAELEERERETEAAVEWLRAAWRKASPAPARAPWRLRLVQRRARLVRTTLAVAAVLAAVLAIRGALVPADESPVEWTSAYDLASRADDVAPVPAPSAAELVASSATHVELRAGNVRLILFTPTSVDQSPSEDSPQ
jgi:hypothetical protein